jgi:DNA invertase Pin-like site-specific DNA recombinase
MRESRPQLNRLMTDAHRRAFDTVLVWKIDRLGRSLKHLVMTLADLEALGVAFISLRDNLDLSTASGRLMFQIIGAMAEFERSLIQRAGKTSGHARCYEQPERTLTTKGNEVPYMAVQNPNLRVALYARVSTTDKGQDPEMQLRELRDYASRREMEIVGEYVDRGVSGAKESRPALDRMLAEAGRRRFDAILVWKIDRLGRSLKHLVMTLADLQALGVAFISLRDNLDLSTASGRLMFQIIGAMAEFERSLIQERVRAGLKHAKAKGKRLGRPKKPVDSVKVLALRKDGHSWRDIAEKMGAGIGTCYRAAKSA